MNILVVNAGSSSLKYQLINTDTETAYAKGVCERIGAEGSNIAHKNLIKERDNGRAVLLISLELEEVMNVPDRILVMYEGEIVGELDPKKTTVEELGLYMAGAKRNVTVDANTSEIEESEVIDNVR